MTQGERINILRKELGLTLEKFGERLGVTKAAVSRIENGVTNLTEQMAKSICRTFNVDYFWLTEGTGEMFEKIKKVSPLDLLSEDYDINEIDKLVILKYLQLSKEDRKSINNFILGVHDIKKDES